MYNEKPQLKLYKYINNSFVLQAIIDDYQSCSFERNLFEAGQFTITINYNIPNAIKFERGLFVQFGSDEYDFGEIKDISDAIGSDGKGSQIRTITGYDSRYIFKRRVIRNLNANENWEMTAKGELCMRNLIADQCGVNAESKRQLPVINTIPSEEDAIGSEYTVSESFTNLYETLVTIATQSEIGWRLKFDGNLTLECYLGNDISSNVRFDVDYESLADGIFTDSSNSYSNAVFVGGKGTGSERDIYEGESAIEGSSPSGLDRFESYDNQTSMTTEEEYANEALSILTQYGQTLSVSGRGLAKCPYIYKQQYDVGDYITIAFSGKSAVVQILSVSENWSKGSYNIDFSFGKPVNDLSRQLQLILNKIQIASNKSSTVSSVKWYTTPTDTEQDKSDVTFDTLGFTGSGGTFTLYLDDEKNGAKEYYIYFKNLTGNLTLTTGIENAETVVIPAGTGMMTIYIDEDGNVYGQQVSYAENATQAEVAESTEAEIITSYTVQDNKIYITSDKVTEEEGKVFNLYIANNINQAYPIYINGKMLYQSNLWGQVNGPIGSNTILKFTYNSSVLMYVVDVIEYPSSNALAPMSSRSLNKIFSGIKIDRIAEMSATSAGEFSLDGDYKFLDYDIVIPVASMYDSYQLMFMPIPKAEVQSAINNTATDSTKNERFVLCGTAGSTDRRIRFGILTDTTFRVHGVTGTSGHLPHFYGFYGVKFIPTF